MNTLIIILIGLMLYWRCKNLYYNSIELEYEYRLFDLRDKLRRSAINGDIDKNSQFFRYLDSSICVTINELPRLNMLSLMMLSWRHRNNREIESFNKRLAVEIEGNKKSALLYDEYGELIFEYFTKRHYFLRILVIMVALTVKVMNGSFMVGKRIKEKIVSIRFYPETSSPFRLT